jgi:hypothetical protein
MGRRLVPVARKGSGRCLASTPDFYYSEFRELLDTTVLLFHVVSISSVITRSFTTFDSDLRDGIEVP